MGSVEKARKVLELTKSYELVEHMAQASTKQIERDMAATVSVEEAKRIVAAVDKVFAKHIPTMIEIVIGGMVSGYSDPELDAMISFYASDLGQSIVSKQNIVNSNNMKEITGYNSYVVYPELQKVITDLLKEMDKELETETKDLQN